MDFFIENFLVRCIMCYSIITNIQKEILSLQLNKMWCFILSLIFVKSLNLSKFFMAFSPNLLIKFFIVDCGVFTILKFLSFYRWWVTIPPSLPSNMIFGNLTRFKSHHGLIRFLSLLTLGFIIGWWGSRQISCKYYKLVYL